jgi:hypothetical protein
MTKQFNFSSESAANVLNHISGLIDSYTEHSKYLYSDTLINRNNGRIEALKDIHSFLCDMFTIWGFEIIELDTEEVEEETKPETPPVFGSIMNNAFSHFSK